MGGRRGAYAPPLKPPGGRHAVLIYSLHGTASKPYADQEMDIRTFYVTQDRSPPIRPNVFCGFADSHVSAMPKYSSCFLFVLFSFISMLYKPLTLFYNMLGSIPAVGEGP